VHTYLLENTKLSVPETQVEQERSTLLRNLLTRMAEQGATREILEQHRDELMGTVARQAEERVKLQYILRQIAGEEQITVAPADVDAAFERLSARYQVPLERLRADVEKQEHGMEQFEADVLREKVIQFLVSQAKIK
jgi:trigger factor